MILSAGLPVIASAAQTAPQARTSGAPPTVSIRVAPSRDPAVNQRLFAAFEEYFEPVPHQVHRSTTLLALSQGVCGHPNPEWARRAGEMNAVTGNAVAAGTELKLPPCPFFQIGGRITVGQNEFVTAAALRELGQAGTEMLRRIAVLNKTTVPALSRVAAGETLRVPYVAPRVTHQLKAAFAADPEKAIRALDAIPGTIRPRLGDELHFVNELDSECDAQIPSTGYPFDAAAVADILERNAAIAPPVRATIGIIDTGVDAGETRLFFKLGPDKSIGINADRRPGPPTISAGYANRAHGTHVAGLALGGLQSDRLTAAVKSRIELKIINIVSRHVTHDAVTGAQVERFSVPFSNLSEAIAYARRNPEIPILNLSVETTAELQSLRDQITPGDYLIVAAAGNSTRDIDIEKSYPAAFRKQLPDRFLTVGASMPDGTRAPFSNRGRESVDLAAPGCRVLSVLPGNETGEMTGSSQAAPLVAFTAGLLYSEGLTVQQVRNRIRSSVALIAHASGDSLATGGVLDIPAAISVYDDLVKVRDSATPLRGRVHLDTCVDVEGECRPASQIARLAVLGTAGPGTATLAWIKAEDGEIVRRAAVMPKGRVRFRPHGASDDVPIDFNDITDILMSVRRRP